MPSLRFAFLTLFLFSSTAFGHALKTRRHITRFHVVEVKPKGLLTHYFVGVGQEPGAKERRLIDKDNDGTLQKKEIEAYLKTKAKRVQKGLQLSLNGRPLYFRFERSRHRFPSYGLGKVFFHYALIFSASFSKKESLQKLQYYDKTVFPHTGEVEVKFVEGPGVSIRRSALWNRPGERLLHFTFKGPESPAERKRELHVDFTTSSSTKAKDPFAEFADLRKAETAKSSRMSSGVILKWTLWLGVVIVLIVLGGFVGRIRLAKRQSLEQTSEE